VEGLDCEFDMPCYRPIDGYYSRIVNASGKRSIVFNPSQGLVDRPVTISCGQCIGCRLEYSRKWAVRCMHEAQLHDRSSFITLTYNDANLPENNSLDVAEFQRFMKRLRHHVGVKLRYFHCGEYGDNFGRPHYHACIFGYDFPDRKLWTVRNGVSLYRSELLDTIWGNGFCSVGDVTFQSAAYVARYVTKKVTGEKAHDHYRVVDKTTGELLFDRSREYVTMSRRPGIGKKWFEKFGGDIYRHDELIVNGFPSRPPKYYDGLYEIENPDGFRRVRRKRLALAETDQVQFESSPDRLAAREKVKQFQVKFLSRSYENG
jgi:hypothetical protein